MPKKLMFLTLNSRQSGFRKQRRAFCSNKLANGVPAAIGPAEKEQSTQQLENPAFSKLLPTPSSIRVRWEYLVAICRSWVPLCFGGEYHQVFDGRILEDHDITLSFVSVTDSSAISLLRAANLSTRSQSQATTVTMPVRQYPTWEPLTKMFALFLAMKQTVADMPLATCVLVKGRLLARGCTSLNFECSR